MGGHGQHLRGPKKDIDNKKYYTLLGVDNTAT
jgi:hypothetical protein